MKSSKARELFSRIYDNVEIALYAMAFAFVIYLLHLFAEGSRNASTVAKNSCEEIAAENASLCLKLDTKRGTEKYNQCLLDVRHFG